jgi:hypothetical protein
MVFTYLKLITGVSTGLVVLRFRRLIDLAFLRLRFSTIVSVGCRKISRGVCVT